MSKYTSLYEEVSSIDHCQDKHVSTAKQMVLADIEEMGEEEFLSQNSSDIANSFMAVCVESSSEQLDEILSLREAEKGLDELGLGEDQYRVDLPKVVTACHNNFSMGMSVLANYLKILEQVKTTNE